MRADWTSPLPASAWFRMGTPVDAWYVLNGAQLAADFAARLRAVYLAGDPSGLLVEQAHAESTLSRRNMQSMANAFRYWYGTDNLLTMAALAMSTTSARFTIQQMMTLLWFVYGTANGAVRQYTIIDTPQIHQESSARPGELPDWNVDPNAILVPPDSILPGIGTPPGVPYPVHVADPATDDVAIETHGPVLSPTLVPTPANPNAGASSKAPLYVAVALLGAGTVLGLWLSRDRILSAFAPAPPPRQRASSSSARG